MHKLAIADGFFLPVEAVTQTFAILAKRGVGKTHTASVMAEEMLKAKQQIVALDPTGAWWGLRSAFPVAILGGEHADVPLEESAGEVIARAIADNGFSAVLDVSLFRKGQMIRFMTTFAETLYRLNRTPVHLFVDEADAFAPQGRSGYGVEENRMLGAMEDIVRRGRKRGIGCTLISQRPAVLNKNVLTQAECLVAMRLIHPADIKAIKEWVGVHGDEKTAAAMIESLPSLPKGAAWFWSPGWGDIFERVQIRSRETFDSSATPKPGEVARVPKSLAQIDLAALGKQIQATVEKAKENDPRELKKRIAELERQARARPVETVVETKLERVEVPVLKNGQLDKAHKLIDRLEGVMGGVREISGALAQAIGRAVAPAAQPTPVRTPVVPKPAPRPVAAQPRPTARESEAKLGRCHLAILRVLSQFPEGCTSGKMTLLAGYRYSGGFKNALSDLRGFSFIEGDNTGNMRITAGGLAQGPFESLPRGPELVNYWLSHPSFGKCERSILLALTRAHPKGMTAAELCEATGYQYSGGFKNSLSDLRTAGVIVGKNTETMRASDDLFDGTS